MARRLVCVCALFACLLWHSQADVHTTVTKSLIGLYPTDYKFMNLPDMYIRDAQCDAYIDSQAFNDVCNTVTSSVRVLVNDKMPPDVKIDLSLANRPQWAVKIYRTTSDCAGEANVTITITCQIYV